MCSAPNAFGLVLHGLPPIWPSLFKMLPAAQPETPALPTKQPPHPHGGTTLAVTRVLQRSNVAVSNLRPNSCARRQELSSSVSDGRRAISAYLSRYLPLVGSQKLSGWNCAITLIGAAGHMLGNPFQHWIRTALDMIGHHQVADRIILAPFGDECEVPGHCLPVPRRFR